MPFSDRPPIPDSGQAIYINMLAYLTKKMDPGPEVFMMKPKVKPIYQLSKSINTVF